MPENTYWKLNASPDTAVRVAHDVIALAAPLVRVSRDAAGNWLFGGPTDPAADVQTTVLSAVVEAWPHVAGLPAMAPGGTAVWLWAEHGWSTGVDCKCGRCGDPEPADIDESCWPRQLAPDADTWVELAALEGRVPLSDLRCNEYGVAVSGAGTHQRSEDEVAMLPMISVVRRWPHTVLALCALQPGRGMWWRPDALHWQEYELLVPQPQG
jgi:hypothetical protein